MMNKVSKRFVLLVTMFSLLCFASGVFADIEYGYDCYANDQCIFVLGNPTAYCSDSSFTCFIPDVAAAPAGAVPVVGVIPVESGVEPLIPGVNVPVVVAPSINNDQLVQLQLTLQLLQEQSSTVEERLAAIESGTVTLSQGYQGLQSQLGQLQTLVSLLQSRIDVLEKEQVSSKQAIKEEVRGVATGLATLQTKVDTTKDGLVDVQEELDTQSSKTTWLTVLFVVLLVAGAGIGLYVYMNAGAEEQGEEVDDQILKYITKHIKAGKKFPQVKEALLKAGWAESDINWAYKETLKKNYQSYLAKGVQSDESTSTSSFAASNKVVENVVAAGSAGVRSSADKRKGMVIGIIGLVVLIGLMFLVKSVGIGHAIYFQNQEDLSKGVHDALTGKIGSNPFYSKLDYLTMCVQVLDSDKAVSYKVTKTPFGHEIEEASLPCDQDIKYDVSFKFKTFDSFDLAAQDFSCENVRKLHREAGDGSRSVVALPSRLVMPGFVKNPTTNYQPFCSVIEECLTDAERGVLGVAC